MLEYGQFLVIVVLYGWAALVLMWGGITLLDYAARLYLARLNDWAELRQKIENERG
jgi:hypothetical protein